MRAIPDQRPTVHRTGLPESNSDKSIYAIYASLFNNLQPDTKIPDFFRTQIIGVVFLQQAMGCIADHLRFWETYRFAVATMAGLKFFGSMPRLEKQYA